MEMTMPDENEEPPVQADTSQRLLSGADDLSKELEAVGFKEDEHMGVPTDRGWGWVIVFCAFINLCLVMGHNRGLSALFVDITEEFQQPNWVVALTFTVMNITGSISTIVSSNILLKRYTARRISVIASLLNAICTIVVSQSSSIVMWLCVYTIKGVSFGTLLTLPMSVIGHYFDKRRSLASSLGMLGGAVAFVALPPLAVHIKTLVGLRGTFLLIGGVELHLVCTSMLLRPPSSYKKIYAKERAEALKKLQKKERGNIIYRPQNVDEHELKPMKSNRGNEYSLFTKKPPPKIVTQLSQQNTKFVDPALSFTSLMSASAPASKTFLEEDCDLSTSLKTETSIGTGDISPKIITSRGSLSPNQQVSERSLNKHRPSSPTGRRKYSSAITGSLLDVVYVGDADELEDNGEDESCDDNEIERDQNSKEDETRMREKRKRRKLCQLSTFIDTSLFKFWTFRMIVGLVACSAFSNFIGVYLPATASSAGIGKQDAAFLMSIAGCVDIVVRIAVGFLADMEFLSKEAMVAVSLLALFVLSNCARFYTTYSLFVMYAILSGAFLGFRPTLLNPMLLDYLGPDRTARAFGICTMLINVVMASNHPIVGVLVDTTGTFTAALHYAGSVTAIGSLFLLTTPICKRLDRVNREREEMAKKMEMQMELT